MILKRLLLEPVSEMGNGAPAPAPASGVAKSKDNTERVRPPTADELKVTFSTEDVPDLVANIGDGKLVEEKPKVAPAKAAEGAEAASQKEKPAEVKPSETKPPEEKKLVEEKPKVEEKPAGEKKEVVEPIITAKAKEETRTREQRMAGLSPEEQAIFKQMSNPAFEHAMKLVEKNRELEAKGGSGVYYQHPQGYVLDPTFNKIQDDARYFDAEFQYWQNQLSLINEGKDWQPLLKWSKDGTPIVGPARKPTSQDAEQVRLAMNDCRTAWNGAQGQLQQFVGGYQQRVSQDVQAVRSELTKRCGWLSKPEMMEDKVEVAGLGERSLKDIQNDFYTMIPPYTRNTLGMEVASHLFIALQVQADQIRRLSATKQVSEIQKAEEKKVEPKPTESAPPAQGKPTPKIGSVKTFTLEGMNDIPSLG